MGPRFKTTKKRQDLADRPLQNGSSSGPLEPFQPPTSSTGRSSPMPAPVSVSQTSLKSSTPSPSTTPTPSSIVQPSPSSVSTPPLTLAPAPAQSSVPVLGFESKPSPKPIPSLKPTLSPRPMPSSASEPNPISTASPMKAPSPVVETSVKSSINNSSANSMPAPSHIPSPHKETYYSYKVRDSTFTWDKYLQLKSAPVAPKEAFRQATVLPKNNFTIGMKLEAKDPRNSSNWCLASVIHVEGLHLRLRFVGADKMNDLYEIIDSENIRPVGSCPSELLLAPTGFMGNIATYTKYVEKVLRDETTIIAPPEHFPPTPPKPTKNLFERGMKLEAVDLKNRDFICPATVGAVDGDKLLITFDGWRGSFDYRCDYSSRDLFPINWCRDVGRALQPPQGWQNMLNGKSLPAWSPPVTPTVSPVRGANISPTKRPRGRPKKDTRKDTSKLAKDHANLSKNTNKFVKERSKSSSFSSSTPEKQSSPDSHESFMPPSPLTPDDGSINKSDPANDGSNIYRYQCQRTVSFNEWQRRKRNEEQMPRELFKVNGGNSAKDSGDTGLNLSDTVSMASTLSSANNIDSSDVDNHGPDSKKFKGDSSESTTDSVIIPKELRNLLEVKPHRLSLWSVEDVLDVLKTESSLSKYIETFHENEIDGKAFELFDEKKRDLLMSMGLKLGPVLKVLNLREQIGQCLNEKNRHTS